MKNLFLSSILMTFAFFSCKQETNQRPTDKSQNAEVSTDMYSCSMHPEVIGKRGDKCTKCGMDLTVAVLKKEDDHIHENDNHNHAHGIDSKTNSEDLATMAQALTTPKEIVANYLALKNALTKDDSRAAATAAKALKVTFGIADAVDVSKRKEFLEISESAIEHAEHIGDNGDKIDHQREHFALLSKDMYDLLTLLGAEQRLYQDYCPMYDNGKGAIWISENKEIRNPYYGSKMLKCGSLKKEMD